MEENPAGNVVQQTDPLKDNPERRKQVEMDLLKMGMSPVEIQKLVNADASSKSSPLGTQPVTTAKPANATMDIHAMAAAAEAERNAKLLQRVNELTEQFPEFRTVPDADLLVGEKTLRDAMMLRRQGKLKEAEETCRRGIAINPKEASGLELLGDILQDVARIEEAMAAYRRAVQADARRSSAEKKYADLLSMQQHWAVVEVEEQGRKPGYSLLLSLLLPGLGQFFNGQTGKGIFFIVADVILFYLLSYSPYGFNNAHQHSGISTALIAVVAAAISVWGVSAWDAFVGAKRKYS